MASRLLSDLDPRMLVIVAAFLRACELEGVDLLITCTYRPDAEQALEYAKGRTQIELDMKGVKAFAKPHLARTTNALPGQSRHNRTKNGVPSSTAIDVVPLINGKCVWGTTGDDALLWQRVGEIGEGCGLEWAGRWQHNREFPHFQMKETP